MTTHPTRLRQIALLSSTANFSHTKHLLSTIFSSPVMFIDPAVAQWGLQNFLIPLGGDIIEVVSPLPSHPGKSTTAGRLLERRGEGGYMIIMQTIDAQAQRTEIENPQKDSRKEARKVIFSHPFSYQYDLPEWSGQRDEGHCIQYHPKGMKGGMMPELDSHTRCSANPTPLEARFSPWHPCGKDYGTYVQGMKKTSDLWLAGCELRLAEGDDDAEGAVEQWSGTFGVSRKQSRRNGEEVLAFTNCEMSFVPGQQGLSEGLASITVEVEGRERLQGIAAAAKKEKVWNEGGWIDMLGVKWYLELKEQSELKARM